MAGVERITSRRVRSLESEAGCRIEPDGPTQVEADSDLTVGLDDPVGGHQEMEHGALAIDGGEHLVASQLLTNGAALKREERGRGRAIGGE